MASPFLQLNYHALLEIFAYITDLSDQMSLANVSSRFADILAEQYAGKLCLFYASRSLRSPLEVIIPEPFDFTRLDVTRLFPNLKVMDVNFRNHSNLKPEDVPRVRQLNQSVRGIIVERRNWNVSAICCFPNLEMLVTSSLHMSEIFRTQYRCFPKLKQLYIRSGSLTDLQRFTFPKLERLHFYHQPRPQDYEYYEGPNFPELKTLEYDMDFDSTGTFNAFEVMDCCPSLENAVLSHRTKNCPVNKNIVNANLKNLIIQQNFPNAFEERLLYEEIFQKYPSLENLALRNCNDISVRDAFTFMNMNRNLKVFDLRGCPNITAESLEPRDSIYLLAGREVKVIAGPRVQHLGDWHVPERCDIVGFDIDFMKTVALCIEDLPVLIISEDDESPDENDG